MLSVGKTTRKYVHTTYMYIQHCVVNRQGTPTDQDKVTVSFSLPESVGVSCDFATQSMLYLKFLFFHQQIASVTSKYSELDQTLVRCIKGSRVHLCQADVQNRHTCLRLWNLSLFSLLRKPSAALKHPEGCSGPANK